MSLLLPVPVPVQASAQTPQIGRLLVDKGLISPQQCEQALELARRWNVRVGQVVIAQGWVRPLDFYQCLAQHFGLDFIDLLQQPPDPACLVEQDSALYLSQLVLPCQRYPDGAWCIATADPSEDTLQRIRAKWGAQSQVVVTSKFDIIWTVQRVFEKTQSHQAMYELGEKDPGLSAQRLLTVGQVLVVYGLLSLLLAGLALAPVATLVVLNLVISVFYMGNFVFKGLLIWLGGGAPSRQSQALAQQAQALSEEELPVFTVLVPMYKEAHILPILTHALRSLDYPRVKLDIKLVLEADDVQTIEAAKQLGLEGIFEIIRVPPSRLQTKPKACNYAMRYARGEYLVIYDAEDKPEPDQLRKVVAAFGQAGPETACIQCRLNYYNVRENWLTRMFTLDYSLWFDLFLPGLERLRIPIPLGGTSNHFRLQVLRELNAWDPFNVTEDADLGIRLSQKGYRVGVIESTTYEEANVAVGNWIRQRSRWIKGYMVTFLVHTRRPLQLVRQAGVRGTLGFVSFVGGTVLAGLLNPLYWGIFGLSLWLGNSQFDAYFPPALRYLALVNLLLGNGMFIYWMMIAPIRRKWLDLVPYSLTVVAYWALMSVAAYKALYQLLRKPFYWEKTEHGLSAFTAHELAQAAQAQAPVHAHAKRDAPAPAGGSHAP